MANADIGRESFVVDKLTFYLETLMVREIKSKLKRDLKFKEKEVLLTFSSELSAKIKTLNLARNRSQNYPNYSNLPYNVLEENLERIYINFIRCCSLSVDSLNTGHKNFTSYNEFKAKLTDFFMKENIPLTREEYENSFIEFKEIFSVILKNKLRKLEIIKNFKEKRKSAKDLEVLSDIIIETFVSITEYAQMTKNNLETYQEEYKIIDAVSETLLLKIQNVEENAKDFNDFVCSLTFEMDFLTESCLSFWYEDNPKTLEESEFFFNNIFQKEEIRHKINKTVNSWITTLENEEMSYKKNQLLFEVTTFNELLNYSIERLKLSSHMDILMYIQVVEEANSMINTTLVKYNIRTIDPLPHTLFNGKEHEVIMTERAAGFKKGEIIKVTNYGYHQEGTVIVRANVIVAR